MARAGDGLDVVVDTASPEKSGGLISLLGPVAGSDGTRGLIDFMSWEAPSWQASGVRPLGWTVIPPLTADGKYTLVLFCAPQVRLTPEHQSADACSGCHYPAWWQHYIDRMQVEIIRVLSPEEVPQIGERADYAAYLTTRYVDRANQPVDDPADAADPRALALAQHAIEQGFDANRLPTELTFFYLPFEHSENLENQHRSVALRGALPDHDRKAESIEHAVRHKEVFERFGRYPHRNAVLGRISTAEEIEFLKTADDNWIKSQMPAENKENPGA